MIPGGVADVSYPKSKLRRGRVQEQGSVSPALTCGCENSIYRIDWRKNMPDLFGNEDEQKELKVADVSKYRIRKLTPKECFRLQGVKDADADKMLSVNSNSQCYKQAGNSITVCVLEALFRNLNIKGVKNWNEIKEDFNPYEGEIFSL